MTSYLVIESQHTRYALELAGVDAVSFLPELAPPPDNAPACVVGVVDRHGEAIAVVDLASRLGHAQCPSLRDQALVFVSAAAQRAALLVDVVHELIQLDVEARIPALHFDADDPLGACFSGQLKTADTLLPLLDPAALLRWPAAAAGAHPGHLDLSTLDAAARELLHRRAQELARPPATRAGVRQSFVMVRIGARDYAIEIDAVRDVFPLDVVRWLPGCPPHVLGATSLRGDILTVISLASWLGGGVADTATTGVVIASLEQRLVLAVDAVLGIEAFNAEQITPRHVEWSEHHLYCKALAHSASCTVGVIDFALLLHEHVLDVDDAAA